MEEIFIWYFEQKGIDNPERFLGVEGNGVNGVNEGVNGVNGVDGVNGVNDVNAGVGVNKTNADPENQLFHLPQHEPQPNADMILGLINLIAQATKGNKNSSELEELVNSMEQLTEVK